MAIVSFFSRARARPNLSAPCAFCAPGRNANNWRKFCKQKRAAAGVNPTLGASWNTSIVVQCERCDRGQKRRCRRLAHCTTRKHSPRGTRKRDIGTRAKSSARASRRASRRRARAPSSLSPRRCSARVSRCAERAAKREAKAKEKAAPTWAAILAADAEAEGGGEEEEEYDFSPPTTPPWLPSDDEDDEPPPMGGGGPPAGAGLVSSSA